ncbi:glycosyltransferase [Mangrovibrevibacter kandeliae]|uniref:glycosyltransferase n=1 Tax=Mangrovibrevibacter kandeliae TaxID=2968473 RepID=UPI0021185DF1|nr:glycosyltransferase family 2 protein [Aurantimonas sp. CSK15Z-1]MCQ8783049.1 glycosyltransferase [Aurantimonas sp. CSK15Z-1]
MAFAFDPVVAVPARDEAARLPRLIAALGAQDWYAGAGRPLPVVIVFNNCTDASLAVALDAAACQPGLALHPVVVAFPAPEAHVGSARRLAVEEALALGGAEDRTVILTTDADAVPPTDWVSANLAALERGADAVGGRLIGDPAEEALLGPDFRRRALDQWFYAERVDRLSSLIDPLPHDPWPRHWDHSGGSLAVRGSAYRAVGGLPALPVREDLGLVSRLRAGGFKLRHDLAVTVTVSARLKGRAAGGMAACIRDWVAAEAEGRAHLVEDPQAIFDRLTLRRALRRLDEPARPTLAEAARLLSMSPGGLRELAERDSGAALVERFAGDAPDAPPTVPVAQAMRSVEAMIATAEGEQDAA